MMGQRCYANVRRRVLYLVRRVRAFKRVDDYASLFSRLVVVYPIQYEVKELISLSGLRVIIAEVHYGRFWRVSQIIMVYRPSLTNSNGITKLAIFGGCVPIFQLGLRVSPRRYRVLLRKLPGYGVHAIVINRRHRKGYQVALM